MYILFFVANINIVLVIAIVIFSILIFPLFISVKLYISSPNKKLYFTVQLFSFIKIVGGYAETIEEGVIIHLTKNKAIIIDKKSFSSMGKKVKPLRDYHVIKFDFLLEMGTKGRELLSMETAFIINYASEIAKWLIYNRKPYVHFDRRIDLYQDRTDLNFYLDSVFLLNLLMILLSFIKILVGKVIYALSRRKQPNQQGN